MVHILNNRCCAIVLVCNMILTLLHCFKYVRYGPFRKWSKGKIISVLLDTLYFDSYICLYFDTNSNYVLISWSDLL